MLSVAFGTRSPRLTNSFISEFFNVQRKFEQILGPGKTPPMDIFPILKYVPERWASWKTTAREIKAGHQKLWYGLLEMCERRIQENRRVGCFIEHVLDNPKQYELTREQLA